jgi:hypothetical protein
MAVMSRSLPLLPFVTLPERMEPVRGLFGGRVPIPVGSASQPTVSQPASGVSGRPCSSMLVMGMNYWRGHHSAQGSSRHAQGLKSTAAVAGSIPAAPAG